MPMRKSVTHGLYSSINKDELLALRYEEGLSNKNIAARTGMSYSTIYRLIGKNDHQGLVDYHRHKAANHNADIPRKDEPTMDKPITLETLGANVTVKGKIAEYEIDCTHGIVHPKLPMEMLNFSDISAFIEELEEIKSTYSGLINYFNAQ